MSINAFTLLEKNKCERYITATSANTNSYLCDMADDMHGIYVIRTNRGGRKATLPRNLDPTFTIFPCRMNYSPAAHGGWPLPIGWVCCVKCMPTRQFWDSGGVKLESLCNFNILSCQWTVNCLLGGEGVSDTRTHRKITFSERSYNAHLFNFPYYTRI